MSLWILTAGCAAFALATVAADFAHAQRVRWVVKPLASTFFVALAVAAGAFERRWTVVLLLAFVLCWVGDLLLVTRNRQAFKAGLFAFLLGHLCFTGAFIARGVELSAAAICGAALAVVAVITERWLLPLVEPRMKKPVFAYVLVIGTMVTFAVASSVATGDWRVAVAAAAMALSDVAVARDRFVGHDPWNKAWGLPLYYGAQILMAWTITAGGR